MIRGLKTLFLILACIIVFLPAFKVPFRFYTDKGLFLLGVIFLTYALLTLRRRVLRQDPHGYRLSKLDFLLLFAFPLYLLSVGNERALSSGDNVATRNLPAVLLRKQTFDLSGAPEFRRKVLPYSALKVGNKILPAFPLGTALLAIPYTSVALIPAPRVDIPHVLFWEKHFAAILSVITISVFFFAIRASFSERAAIGSTIVFGLATTVFTCTSQALWSFSGELFFVVIALGLLLNGTRVTMAALAMGGAFLCRPTAAVIALLFFFILMSDQPRYAVRFAATFALTVCLVALFHYSLYGHAGGGYVILNSKSRLWQSNFWSGLFGVLFSPSRGMLLYFPYLLLIPFGFSELSQDKKLRIWITAALAAISFNCLMIAFYSKWWGGYSIGPRLLTESAPFFAIATLPVWKQWNSLGWKRAIFVVLLTYSILTQFSGAYNETVSRWNGIVKVDKNPSVLFSWKNSQLAATWNPFWRMEDPGTQVR